MQQAELVSGSSCSSGTVSAEEAAVVPAVEAVQARAAEVPSAAEVVAGEAKAACARFNL